MANDDKPNLVTLGMPQCEKIQADQTQCPRRATIKISGVLLCTLHAEEEGQYSVSGR